MRTEAEVGVMLIHAKEPLEPPGAGGGRKEGPLELPSERVVLLALISHLAALASRTQVCFKSRGWR